MRSQRTDKLWVYLGLKRPPGIKKTIKPVVFLSKSSLYISSVLNIK